MKNNIIKLSAVVIAKNEEVRIATCLKSLLFCDEIIVVDNGSTDKTKEIAKEYNASVIRVLESNFSQLRNRGKQEAKGTWILYVDADEVISEKLRKEIIEIIGQETMSRGQLSDDHCHMSLKYNGYFILRQNYYLEQKWPIMDRMQRLFLKDALIRWEGILHETAIVDGSMGVLHEPLIHHTHRTLEEMVEKTNEWSGFEARLRYDTHHPKIVWWRLLRVMWTGFFKSFVQDGGWRAGTVGWIESIYQGYSMFITYAKLWEMQEKKVSSI